MTCVSASIDSSSMWKFTWLLGTGSRDCDGFLAGMPQAARALLAAERPGGGRVRGLLDQLCDRGCLGLARLLGGRRRGEIGLSRLTRGGGARGPPQVGLGRVLSRSNDLGGGGGVGWSVEPARSKRVQHRGSERGVGLLRVRVQVARPRCPGEQQLLHAECAGLLVLIR